MVNIFGRVDNHRKSLLSDGTPYDMGAQQCVWSMTKVVMCTVIMIAVERGWLKYDDPIAKHWPEFAEKFGPDSEKAKATITQALRHELGELNLLPNADPDPHPESSTRPHFYS